MAVEWHEMELPPINLWNVPALVNKANVNSDSIDEFKSELNNDLLVSFIN